VESERAVLEKERQRAMLEEQAAREAAYAQRLAWQKGESGACSVKMVGVLLRGAKSLL
jgi:hypothetical protein